MKAISAQVAVRDAARLEQLAKAADRTLSAELRRAVREHLNRNDQETTR